MPKQEIKENEKLTLAVVRQMLQLATSGFGLVAALAWNEAIKTVITEFIRPYIGGDSSLVSLLIYAVVVTVLAVTVTYQLAKLGRRLERETEEE